MAPFIFVKNAARKIVSLGFILLGLTPLLFVLAITIKKHNIKERMEEEMENRELQTIILPTNEVVWMDKHEIFVKGQMFDIHTKELINDVYHFTGLFDAEETELMEEERKNAGRTKMQNELLLKLFKSLPLFYYMEPHDVGKGHFATHHHIYLQPGILNPIREIITPPPRFSC